MQKFLVVFFGNRGQNWSSCCTIENAFATLFTGYFLTHKQLSTATIKKIASGRPISHQIPVFYRKDGGKELLSKAVEKLVDGSCSIVILQRIQSDLYFWAHSADLPQMAIKTLDTLYVKDAENRELITAFIAEVTYWGVLSYAERH